MGKLYGVGKTVYKKKNVVYGNIQHHTIYIKTLTRANDILL